MATYFVSTAVAASDANNGRDHLGRNCSGGVVSEVGPGFAEFIAAGLIGYVPVAGDRIHLSSVEVGFVNTLCEVISSPLDGAIIVSPFPGAPSNYTNVSSSNGPKRTLQGGLAAMATGDTLEIQAGTYSLANGGMTDSRLQFGAAESGKTLTLKAFTRPSGITTPEAVTITGANTGRSLHLMAAMASGSLEIRDLTLASSEASAALFAVEPAFTNPIMGRLVATFTRVTFTCAQSQTPFSCESTSPQAMRAGAELVFADCDFNTVSISTAALLIQYVRRVVLDDCHWTGGARAMAAFQGPVTEIVIRRATNSNWTGTLPDPVPHPPVLANFKGLGFDFSGLAYPGCELLEISNANLTNLSCLLVYATQHIRRAYLLANTATFRAPPTFADPSDVNAGMLVLGMDSSGGGYNEYGMGSSEDEASLHHSAAATAGTTTTVTLASMTTPLTDRDYTYYAVLIDEATGLALATRRIVSVSGNVLTAESAWGVSPTWTDVAVTVARVERGRSGIVVVRGNTLTNAGYHRGHGILTGLKTRNAYLWGNFVKGCDTCIVWKAQGGSCCFNRTYGGVGLGPKGGRGTYMAHNSHFATDDGGSSSSALAVGKQFNTASLNHGCEHNTFENNILDCSAATGAADVAFQEQDSADNTPGAGPCGYDNLINYNALVKGPNAGAANIFGVGYSTLATIQAAWAAGEFVHTGTVAAASATTLTMDGAAPSGTRKLVDSDVEILTGTGSYQKARIIGQSGLVLTVAAWDATAGTPAAGATFRINGRRRSDNDASSVLLSGTAFRDPATGDYTIVGANGIPVFAAGSDGLAIGYAQPKTGASRGRVLAAN